MIPIYRTALVILGAFLVTSPPASGTVRPTTIGKLANKPVMLRDGEPVMFLGVQYWGLDTWNRRTWDKDLQRMRDLGFNGIRLNIAWDHIEPRDGVFDFGPLDALLDRIERHGFMVYLQLNQSAHNWKPAWFIKKHQRNNIHALDHTGEPQFGRLSFASPAFRKAYRKYVRRTVTHVRNRECLVAYSIYTEPHYADRRQWLDYSRDNCDGFRRWLGSRYGSIAELNAAWNRSLSGFQQVQPDPPPASDWEQMEDTLRQPFLDWRLWNCVVKAEFIGGLIGECRRIDPNHLYGQNMMWKWTHGHAATVALDPLINYEYADIVGINVYPRAGRDQKVSDTVSFAMSLFNNSKVVWLSEFNAKEGSATQDTLSRFWSAGTAAGASGFVYFTWRGSAESKDGSGNDIRHYGLVTADGRPKPSLASLQAAFSDTVLARQQTALNTRVPVPRVQFLWCQSSPFLTYLDDSYGLPAWFRLRHWLTHMRDIEVAVVTEEQLASRHFDPSRPLIVPGWPFVSQETAQLLRHRIEDDGLTVLIAGRFGEFRLGPNGVSRQPYPRVDDITGLTMRRYTQSPQGHEITLAEDFVGRKSGARIRHVQDKVFVGRRDDMTIVGRWSGGKPALLCLPRGQGRIVYCGTSLFRKADPPSEDAISNLLAAFVKWADKP